MTIYLSGCTNDRHEQRLIAAGCGLLIQPGTNDYRRRLDRYPAGWAADNGCFAKGDSFDAPAWLAWLDTLPRAGCLFAVAPDVVGDHVATLARSTPHLAADRGLGFPAAFVGQNGATPEAMPWDDFDALFLGGSPECLPCGWVRPMLAFDVKSCPTCGLRLTEWKLSLAARALVVEAKRRGKFVHMGRVNSKRRMDLAADMGCDSADGTFLGFGPDRNIGRIESWFAQPRLALEAV
jgi:hypothetical protein